MKFVFVFFILTAMLIPSDIDEFTVREGDIFFQDADCGDFCEAIERVTSGYMGCRLSHVGIALCIHNEVYIAEALSKGVSLTPLKTFLARSLDKNNNPKVIVGRLKKEYMRFIIPALHYILSRTGEPYDELFNLKNKSYYCSELIYLAFLNVSGKEIFKTAPMSFKDPVTGRIFKIWKEYFRKRSAKIPQGEPGLNPGMMSRSPNMDIIYFYGIPKGFKKSESK